MTRARIRFGEGPVFQLRLELEGITPAVWRRILVSARASLMELHEVIERAIGAGADAGYHFDVDGIRYGDPLDEPVLGRRTDTVALESLGLHLGARFHHIAEHHGEPWRHAVTLERSAARLVGQRLPSCITGCRAAPPPECAGPGAFRELLAQIADPLDPRAAEWRNWLPEHFDPDYADVTAINAALARIPKHRPAA